MSLKVGAQNLNYGASLGYDYNISSMYSHLSLLLLCNKTHEVKVGFLSGSVESSFGEKSGFFENFELGDNKIRGVRFGYSYVYSNKTNWNPILNFDFSTYQVERDEYRRVPMQSNTNKIRVIENTLTIGVNHRIVKDFYGSIAFGIGSYNGFFLMFDSFMIKGSISLKYYL